MLGKYTLGCKAVYRPLYNTAEHVGLVKMDILVHNNLPLLAARYGLRQLISEPTTNYNSALDHIYTNLPPERLCSSGVLESYYSDHKPIYFVLQS